MSCERFHQRSRTSQAGKPTWPSPGSLASEGHGNDVFGSEALEWQEVPFRAWRAPRLDVMAAAGKTAYVERKGALRASGRHVVPHPNSPDSAPAPGPAATQSGGGGRI